MVGEVPAEFDALVRAPERGRVRPPAGRAGPDLARIAIFGFAAQLASLKQRS
jgi:hypothetical protein